MKCLVCISKTADTTSKIAFDASGKNFLEDGVQFILNPYDEWYGLVKAIELRDAMGGQVDVVHVGPVSSEILIRKALAIGADSAFRIDDQPIDAYQVACQISSFAKDKSYDIVFTGKETIDYNGAEVGPLLAASLNWPFVPQCSKLDIEENNAICLTAMDGGFQKVEVQLPFVVAAAKGMAEQKIPNMKGIIDAKKKPLETLVPTPTKSKVELIQFEIPEAKKGVQMVDAANIEQLTDILQHELKLI